MSRHRAADAGVVFAILLISFYAGPLIVRAEASSTGMEPISSDEIPAKLLIDPRRVDAEMYLRLDAQTTLDGPGAPSNPMSQSSSSNPTVGNSVSSLTFIDLRPIKVGEHSVIRVQLSNPSGENVGAVGNEALILFVEGVRQRRTRTDSNGIASFPFRLDLPAGKYPITVVYEGTSWLQPSTASAELIVEPAEVEIRTIPPLPGLRFSLAGRVFVSNQSGVARISVEKSGQYPLEILPLKDTQSGLQLELNRWGDEVFAAFREVKVPLDKPLEVGFNVRHKVRQTFVDLAGNPVDPARITSLTLKGSNGILYEFEDGQPRWLQAGRVVRRASGLEETKIQYSVMSVIVDGANVVNQAQQRFYVHPDDVWQVRLILYSARFTARDALFRFPIGSGILVEYPGGGTQTFPFGPNAEVRVNSLARGSYRVTVVGAQGMAPPTPMALSRNQEVELLVLSHFDMVVFFGTGVSLALAILFVGRPELLALVIAFPSFVITKLLTVLATMLTVASLRRDAIELSRYFQAAISGDATGSIPAPKVSAGPPCKSDNDAPPPVTTWEPPSLVTIAPRNEAVVRICPTCHSTTGQHKHGTTKAGRQRYRCHACRHTYSHANRNIHGIRRGIAIPITAMDGTRGPWEKANS